MSLKSDRTRCLPAESRIKPHSEAYWKSELDIVAEMSMIMGTVCKVTELSVVCQGTGTKILNSDWGRGLAISVFIRSVRR